VDEPHHLLDLLGDIGVVHLGGGGSDVPSGCSARSGDRRECWSEAAHSREARQAGSPREWSRRGGRGASLAAGAT
jgi:hypothetical protein